MSTYLARIEHVNDYYNIRPVMELVNNGFVEVDEKRFGQYGTIAIGAIYGQYTESPLIQENRYVMFSLTDSELSALEQTYSGYKIKAVDYILKTKTIDTFGIREVIDLPKTCNAENFLLWGQEALLDIMQPITNSVYLSDGSDVFGPFSWKMVSDGNYKFYPLSLNGDPYVLKSYKRSNFEEIIYSFDAAKRATDIYYGRERHILIHDSLPDTNNTIDCIDDKNLKEFVVKLLSKTAETRKAQKEIRDAVLELPTVEISEKRKARILELIKNDEVAEQTIALIPSLVLNDPKSLEKIAQIFLDNSNFSEKLYPVVKEQAGFANLLEKLETERKNKQNELEAIEKRIEEAKEASAQIGEVSSDEIKQLENTNKELLLKLEEYRQLGELKIVCDQLQQEYEETRNQYNAVLTMKNSLSSDIEKKVREAYSSLAFDGALASMMMQEAAKFEKKKNKKSAEAMIVTKNAVEEYSRITEPNDLLSFLYQELTLRAKRNLSKNDIANLLICLSQGFLTVLAGEPGSGKTSLISLMSNILGLQVPQYTRYTEIAVEKGWTSRRDFIGYYNPLTKTFDASNKGMFTALSVLKAEVEAGIYDFPYFVLLDEANLSQMEHYWADFMNVCDFDKSFRSISLSEDYVYPISETLRFVATINLDHTTEILSPRLIDRAWIVMIQASDVLIEDLEPIEILKKYPMITYEPFKKLCTPAMWTTKNLDLAIVDKFNRIRTCFQDVGINFSPRVIGMIKRYCLAGKGFFDVSENVYTPLDYAVMQKILPMINGYGENYLTFLNRLQAECDQNTMPKCYEILQSILRKGNTNMQYYQFFAR